MTSEARRESRRLRQQRRRARRRAGGVTHTWILFDGRARSGDTDDAVVYVCCDSESEVRSYTLEPVLGAVTLVFAQGEAQPFEVNRRTRELLHALIDDLKEG